MKSIAVAALLGAVSASSLNACNASGINGAGLSCVPQNVQLFATGNNGDEDLGEDIIMKGEPYHYTQKKNTQRLSQEDPAAEDTTVADKKDAMEDEKMKEAEVKEQKVAAAAKEKKIGPVEKVSILEPITASEHTTFYYQKPRPSTLIQLNADGDEKEDNTPKPVKGWESVSGEAEKLSILDQGQVTMSFFPGNPLFSFPQPYRTAFYVQTGDEEGLWKME